MKIFRNRSTGKNEKEMILYALLQVKAFTSRVILLLLHYFGSQIRILTGIMAVCHTGATAGEAPLEVQWKNRNS